MSGFLVALAGLIAVNQLENFKTKDHEFFTGIKMANTILFTLVSLGIAVYGVIAFNIKLTKKDANVIHIPGGLMAMFAITAFVFMFSKYYDLVRVKDLGKMTPSLPSFQIPMRERGIIMWIWLLWSSNPLPFFLNVQLHSAPAPTFDVANSSLRSAEDRLSLLTTLRNKRLITNSEFKKKRLCIISTL